MEKNEWLEKAAQSILDTDDDGAKEIAHKSLEDGIDPLEMINKGFTEGIRKMGDLFDRGEVFLPGLLIASEAMTAAVKILATRGDGSRLRYNGSLLVTARPYTPRLSAIETQGLKLATYPHPRLTPLADHKTLNYLYYYRAGGWAGAADGGRRLQATGLLR